MPGSVLLEVRAQLLDRELLEADAEALGTAAGRPSRVSPTLKRVGIERPSTRSGPSASAASAATSAESMPPETAISTRSKPFFCT